MISKWTSHLKTTEEKERFKNSVLGSKQVLSRLQEIINEIEDEQDKIERDVRIYDTPSWAYRQAHLNGFRECLAKINKVITVDQ